MKRLILLCLAALSIGVQAMGVRRAFQMEQGWRAVCYPEDTARYGDSIVVDHLSVPHTFDDYYSASPAAPGHLRGKAIYDFTFNAVYPVHDADVYYRLCIEGAGSYLTVIFNEDTLCTHRAAGPTTTVLPVNAQHVYYQKNHLRIICESPSRSDSTACDLPLGLFRIVYLGEMYGLHIQPNGVHTWCNATCDTLFVETEVENLHPYQFRKFELHTVLHPLSNTDITLTSKVTKFNVGRGKTKTVRQAIPVREIIRWSPDRPYMYVVSCSLKGRDFDSGNMIWCDKQETEFGFRTLAWEDSLKVNGVPVAMKGIWDNERSFGHDYALYWTEIDHRCRQIKRLGFNTYVGGDHPHNLRYLRNWNRLGVMEQTRFASPAWYDTTNIKTTYKRLLRQWVKERRNNPSVVQWVLPDDPLLTPDFRQECETIIRTMDPTGRKVTIGAADSTIARFEDYYTLWGEPHDTVLTLTHDTLPAMAELDTAALIYRGVPGMNYLYRYNCGGDSLVDSWGQLWMGDNDSISSPVSNTFGAIESDVCVCLPGGKRDRLPASDQPLMRTFRWGRQNLKFRFPVDTCQTYSVDIFSIEPWETLPGGRVYNTAINGVVVGEDKDACYIAGGRNRLIRTSYLVNSNDTPYLEISFPLVRAGQAVVCAIAISGLSLTLP